MLLQVFSSNRKKKQRYRRGIPLQYRCLFQFPIAAASLWRRSSMASLNTMSLTYMEVSSQSIPLSPKQSCLLRFSTVPCPSQSQLY